MLFNKVIKSLTCKENLLILWGPCAVTDLIMREFWSVASRWGFFLFFGVLISPRLWWLAGNWVTPESHTFVCSAAPRPLSVCWSGKGRCRDSPGNHQPIKTIFPCDLASATRIRETFFFFICVFSKNCLILESFRALEAKILYYFDFLYNLWWHVLTKGKDREQKHLIFDICIPVSVSIGASLSHHCRFLQVS